jgi:hypothetical protein
MNTGIPLPRWTITLALHNTPLSSTDMHISQINIYFGVSWVDLARGNWWREISKFSQKIGNLGKKKPQIDSGVS